MTAILLPNGKQQYFTTAGLPAVGYKVATFDAGTSNPRTTWADALKVGANANPIILDARGEASIFWDGAYKVQLQDSTGAVIWTQDNLQSQQNSFSGSLVPAVTNTVDLGSVTLSWRNLYLGASNTPVLDTTTGNIGYFARTAAEIAASVTPVNFTYLPGHVLRYGTNTTPGTTDMTAPINNALASNKRVYAPAGTYFCSAALNLASGQTLFGDGPTTILQWSNPNISNVVGNAITNTTVRDLRINVTSSAGVTSLIGGLVFSNNSVACKAERVEISGVNWAGVWITGSSRCVVHNCYFHDFLGTVGSTADVFVTDDAGGVNRCDYNIVSDCECFGGGWFGIGFMEYLGAGAAVQPSYCTAIGNRIGQHQAYGILMYNVAHNGNVWNSAIGNYVENALGSVITNNSGMGIYAAGAGGVVISGNTVNNCLQQTTGTTLTPGAIAINGSAGLAPFTITGNHVINPQTFYGIQIGSCPTGGVVTGNTVSLQSGAPQIGIYILNSSNVTVSGNTVTITTSIASTAGIFVFASGAALSNITISGNNINGCSSRGIRLDQAGGFTISNYVVSNNIITGGSAACNPIGLVAGANGSVTGNIGTATTVAALNVNGVLSTRYANNVFTSTGTSAVTTTGVCTGSYFDKTNLWNGTLVNAATGLICEQLASAVPSTGTAAVGDRAEMSVPVVGQPKGWRCTVAASPGTWVSEGNL